MTHHPHVHMIVPGGGLAEDGERWIACRKGFFVPVKALSKLFRGIMLAKLVAAHNEGQLKFHGRLAHLNETRAFKRALRPVYRRKWFVYAKKPFAGPKAVLAYLSRYTHRVAISNSRLIKDDAEGVTFRVKNYRRNGPARYTTMILHPHEFIRRVLIHVLPKGLHRIRHYGLFASGAKAGNLAKMRNLLGVKEPIANIPEDIGNEEDIPPSDDVTPIACPCCGGRMRIIEVFKAGCKPRATVEPQGIDSS